MLSWHTHFTFRSVSSWWKRRCWSWLCFGHRWKCEVFSVESVRWSKYLPVDW